MTELKGYFTNMRSDKEFKELLPQLTEKEFNKLQTNILNESIINPIIIWKEEDTVLDGHNRLLIYLNNRDNLKSINLDFLPKKELSFSSKELAKRWIIRNQLGRRNLTNERRKYYLGYLYNDSKCQGKRIDLTCGQNDHKLNTAQQLAEENNLSEKTIRRAGDYASNIEKIFSDEEIVSYKEKVLNGEIKLSVSEINELAKDEYKEYLIDVFDWLENKHIESATQFIDILNNKTEREKEFRKFADLIRKLEVRLETLQSPHDIRIFISNVEALLEKAIIKQEKMAKNIV